MGFLKPVRDYFRPERGEFFEMGIAVLNIKSVSVLDTVFNVLLRGGEESEPPSGLPRKCKPAFSGPGLPSTDSVQE